MMKTMSQLMTGWWPVALLLLGSQGLAAGQAPSSAPGVPDEDPWPRVIEAQGSTLKIYQPQLNSWTGNSLDAYAAVGVKNEASGNVD
jgi:hypothetical protein